MEKEQLKAKPEISKKGKWAVREIHLAMHEDMHRLVKKYNKHLTADVVFALLKGSLFAIHDEHRYTVLRGLE